MKTTIGLEIHAELKTKTKMFCGSLNDPHHAEPNTHVCPVCMGHPGTLPVINKEAVKHVLKVGLAIGGNLASFTEFDRKNYFYPDIPKGYQISQYKYPLVEGGELAGVKITKVHLEEDTARSIHGEGGSLIDYNRAGVPLMELVTEPVIHDAKTAGEFARELQLLLRTLGASDANMELGEMRVEANISVSDSDKLGTLVEVKNLNSFKSVTSAIEYEVKRQMAEPVVRETRGWDEAKGRTYTMRTKETAEDYRYFPDPDLPKLNVAEMFSKSRLTEELPELAPETRSRYQNLGLPRDQIEIIISDLDLKAFFEKVLSEGGSDGLAKAAANYLTSDAQALLADAGHSLENAHSGTFVALMEMVLAKEITSRVAKDLLAETLFEGKDPGSLAKERGLVQQSSAGDLMPVVEQVLKAHEDVVEEYRNGKEPALQFLVGQGMKATKGSANPEVLRSLLAEAIKK